MRKRRSPEHFGVFDSDHDKLPNGLRVIKLNGPGKPLTPSEELVKGITTMESTLEAMEWSEENLDLMFDMRHGLEELRMLAANLADDDARILSANSKGRKQAAALVTYDDVLSVASEYVAQLQGKPLFANGWKKWIYTRIGLSKWEHVAKRLSDAGKTENDLKAFMRRLQEQQP